LSISFLQQTLLRAAIPIHQLLTQAHTVALQ